MYVDVSTYECAIIRARVVSFDQGRSECNQDVVL